MKGGNSLMDWIVKLIFFLMLLPVCVSLALNVIGFVGHMIAMFFLAALQWVFVFALDIGGVACSRAAWVMRRRLPPRNHNDPPPPVAPPVRRPRGPGFDEEE